MSAGGRARQWSAYIPFDFVSTYCQYRAIRAKDCRAVILRLVAPVAFVCLVMFGNFGLILTQKRADLAIPEGSIRVLTTRTHGVATHAKL